MSGISAGSRNCLKCGSAFNVSEQDLAFLQKLSPRVAGQECSFKPPKLCPDCRKQRRLCFRNERNLFSRVCDLCTKKTLSVYSPDLKGSVYCEECWSSDKWDAIQYSRDLQFDKPLSLQFQELLQAVPLRALYTVNNENSKYTNLCGGNRNCYLVFNSSYNEDCYYVRGLSKSRNCLDMYYGLNNELCYECINIHNCYNLLFSQNCSQCHQGRFLYNCVGCSECFCCSNLRNKQYCFCNEQLSSSEYQKRVEQIAFTFSNLQSWQVAYQEMVENAVHRINQSINVENCTGDYLANAKNCRNCFEVHDSEDCVNCDCIKWGKDLRDAFGNGLHAEVMYETVASGRSQGIAFCTHCEHCTEVYYSVFCEHCRNVFACTGLKNREYCILNKQYSPEDYGQLLVRLVDLMQKSGEWSEFFPASISPLAYNQALAMEYFPLSKPEVAELGCQWSDYENPAPPLKQVVKSSELPDDIQAVSEDILDWGIHCEETGKPFRIISQELTFLKQMGLPLPHDSFDVRYLKRLTSRNPHKLWQRFCSNCEVAMESSFAPERVEKVYCEDCYRGFVS